MKLLQNMNKSWKQTDYQHETSKKFLKTSARCFHIHCTFVSSISSLMTMKCWIILKSITFLFRNYSTCQDIYEINSNSCFAYEHTAKSRLNYNQFFSRFYSLSLGFLPVISANIWINLGQFCKYAYKMLVELYCWVATSLLCKQSVIRNLQIPKHCTGVENRVANLSTFWR